MWASERVQGSVPNRRYHRAKPEGVPTPEHLLFRWSPTGYALDVRSGEAPHPGVLVAEGESRFRVTKVAASPLPGDSRPCAYLLPATSLNGNESDHAYEPADDEPVAVWTEPRDDLTVLLDTYPAGPCVVAADAEGRRLGLTVDSLTSLSLDPPLVGFALESDSPMCELLDLAGGCVISILAGGQQWLADHFAGGARPVAMWHALAQEPGAVGAPLYVGALGWLECSLLESIVLGQRTLFVCAVRRVESGRDAPALVHARGEYGVA